MSEKPLYVEFATSEELSEWLMLKKECGKLHDLGQCDDPYGGSICSDCCFRYAIKRIEQTITARYYQDLRFQRAMLQLDDIDVAYELAISFPTMKNLDDFDNIVKIVRWAINIGISRANTKYFLPEKELPDLDDFTLEKEEDWHVWSVKESKKTND